MPASYPTSIKSFTTKVDDVDDVMAADVNDLQLEVAAIETALGVGKATSVIQVVNTQSGAVASGSTALPADDTIPQNTEGDEVMTLAITPKSATNKLKIEVVVHFSTTPNSSLVAALFQDSTAGALACGRTTPYSAALIDEVTFTHYMTTGTTSATTFKVRIGAEGGTTTFNGVGGSRLYGGVLASSITITEYKA